MVKKKIIKKIGRYAKSRKKTEIVGYVDGKPYKTNLSFMKARYKALPENVKKSIERKRKIVDKREEEILDKIIDDRIQTISRTSSKSFGREKKRTVKGGQHYGRGGIIKKILQRWKKPVVMGGRGKHLEKYSKARRIKAEKRRQIRDKVESYEAGQAWSRTVPPTRKKLTGKEYQKNRKRGPTIPVKLTPKEKQALKEWESKINPKRKPLKFGKGGAVKKVGKEIMSYVGKKVHKKKPVVKKPVTKKSTNPYSLADWKQGIKHKGKGYSRGGRIKKGITIIVDPKGRAKIKESVKQAKERGEKELEDFIKNLNPKKFQSGGLVKPKSVRIAKRGWGKVIK
jgi:hypothetical protein